ncbi:MAG: DsbC family protein [Rhodoferax sp.]
MTFRPLAALCAFLLTSAGALADDAQMRKTLGERLPQLPPIDEISKTPIPGLYEVRVNGADIYYVDEKANYLIQGNIIDIQQKRNLTEERINKLTAIAFDSLPFKDAFAIVRGNGKRKLAVFEDPNCGYCKRFERDLQKINNITVYVFLYPILSQDSLTKSKAVWCAKDRAKAWQDWMLNEIAPAEASCDTSALDRNRELGRKHRINGTPTLIFADGSRTPGAMAVDQIEKRLR